MSSFSLFRRVLESVYVPHCAACDVRVESAEAPGRLEWARADSKGVIELVASGWGTRVRAEAKAKGVPWQRVEAHRDLERSLRQLLDHLGASSLQAG